MTADLRRSILDAIAHDGGNVAARLAEQHGVSRQSASAWLAKLKREGARPLRLDGTGRETRDFIYVWDAVQAYLAVLGPSRLSYRQYNVGTGIATPIHILVQQFINVCLGHRIFKVVQQSLGPLLDDPVQLLIHLVDLL